MASRYKDKDAGVVLSFSGQWVSWSHTAFAYRVSPRSLCAYDRSASFNGD